MNGSVDNISTRQTRKAPAGSPATRLLKWYDKNRRDLPWRAKPGQTADPYRVWLSEIMLQQTTVAAVGPYYRKFLKQWPSVHSLAAAELDDVLAVWSGLGYYARARNLHSAAKVIADEHCGVFPHDAARLRKLPGVGVYTAGAIAAIAFDAPEVAVDANAERVLARYFAVKEPLPKAKSALREHGLALLPKFRSGDFAQAMMDLGALICTPQSPACMQCPWMRSCRGRQLRIADQLPRKAAKRERPLKRGAAFVVRDANGAVLLVKRPENGLLASMWQPPLGPWTSAFPSPANALKQAPFDAPWKKHPGIIRHGFTHFEIEFEVYAARVSARPACEGRWVEARDLGSTALPTVMRKILVHAAAL